MSQAGTELGLGPRVRATLLELLEQALEIPTGGDVLDHLPSNPWGDLEDLRRSVYAPLHGRGRQGDNRADRQPVVVEAEDVEPIRSVLDGLAESFSDGVPWVAVSPAERRAIERLILHLRD